MHRGNLFSQHTLVLSPTFQTPYVGEQDQRVLVYPADNDPITPSCLSLLLSSSRTSRDRHSHRTLKVGPASVPQPAHPPRPIVPSSQHQGLRGCFGHGRSRACARMHARNGGQHGACWPSRLLREAGLAAGTMPIFLQSHPAP